MGEHLLRDDIEYVIHCESDGTIIGPLSKKHAHLEGVQTILTHYSTWAVVYNPLTKKYGLQLKTPKEHDKFSKPKWDMGVAGHNCYVKENNTYKPLSFSENLIKECDEEIGLTVQMCYSVNELKEKVKHLKGSLGYVFEKFLFQNNTSSEWVGGCIIFTSEEQVKFKDGEVIDFKWATSEEMEEILKKPETYYDALPVIHEKAKNFIKKIFS